MFVVSSKGPVINYGDGEGDTQRAGGRGKSSFHPYNKVLR